MPAGEGSDEAAETDRERFRRQHGRTICGFCGWSYEGTFGDGRQRLGVHRRDHHPDAGSLQRRPRPRSR